MMVNDVGSANTHNFYIVTFFGWFYGGLCAKKILRIRVMPFLDVWGTACVYIKEVHIDIE